MKLGEIIKSYRVQNNLSTRAFAELSKLSCGYISMLENDRNPHSGKSIAPTILTVHNIANAMGKSVDELLAEMDATQAICVNDNPGQSITLSKHEEELIRTYRAANPALQAKVDQLLNIETRPVLQIENEPRYKVRFAGRDGSIGEKYLTKEEIDALDASPDVEDL